LSAGTLRGHFTETERAMMARALALASRGAGSTSPNPMVGAVLASGEEIIAEGYHARFGGPHAERRLLASLAASGRRVPRDSVLFLTLEPCTYEGKTPPCTQALLPSPIRRVVVAAHDPNPIVTGRGLRALRAAGWEVRSGLLAEDAERLIRPFTLARQHGRAMVTLKIASTLDGMLADFRGRSRWITGALARGVVGRMRTTADAIVVGRGTVEDDDPRLGPGILPGRSPGRIVIDSRLSIDPDCRLARIWRREVAGSSVGAGRVIGNWVAAPAKGNRVRYDRRPRLIIATARPPARKQSAFERLGWEVWDLPNRRGRVDLPALARRSAREGLIDLLVEPGPELVGGFLQSGPVDRVVLFVAPMILGGDRGWGGHLNPRPLPRALKPRLSGSPVRVGDDLLLHLEGPGGRPLVPPRRGA
jgi:diaminohydroxyphosphoribosylaminopyrimidine deaminase / 5-amino-6-(5-phosphoribosylamino)uracil reductase